MRACRQQGGEQLVEEKQVSTQTYTPKNFKPSTMRLIAKMQAIILEYQAQGFVLTVRQLYYQLVARAEIENTLNDYKRVASILNDAKLAGYLDWDAIEDRTREFSAQTRWKSGKSIVQAAHDSFHMDMWKGQETRVFVIVEKEALVGVLEPVCRRYDVPLLAARGFPSGSVLREFAVEQILPALLDEDQYVRVLHLGDHDPSGIDMSRDLRERLELFCELDGDNYFHQDKFALNRIALTMDQVREQKPPRNPAKDTDARYDAYKAKFGTSSWELDALSPTYLDKLVEEHLLESINAVTWKKRAAEVVAVKKKLAKVAKEFQE
jgi:hypothetical protein